MTAHSQDSVLMYSHILKVDTLSKNQIFDKALIWCSKSFKESKSAINVKEREGGIIAGKAKTVIVYYIPTQKDSTLGLLFYDYRFDWLIEIKDNKLRFSAKNIEVNEGAQESYLPVTTKIEAPTKLTFTKQSKVNLWWKLSKEAFIRNLDKLMLSLYDDLIKKEESW
jgi:hypothetical protein